MPRKTEEGAVATEYALIAFLVAATIAGAVFTFGQANKASWENSCTQIATAMDTTCGP